MITKLYAFYDLPFDHDTCHLFEHVVMREFTMKLREHGYSRPFFGSVHGQTIDSTIFFDVGVYNDEIMQLFASTLESPVSFDDQIVEQSLHHIEAEMSAKITIKDRTLLDQQLRCMIQPRSETKNVSTENVLEVVERPKLFHDVAAVISVYDTSVDITKAFFCLYPALLDIVRDAALDNESVYSSGLTSLDLNEDANRVGQKYTIAKTVNLEDLIRDTERYLRAYDVSNQTSNLEMYRDSFKSEAWYNAAPIHYYEETGIRTTREELAELITPDRLEELLHKMSVQMMPIVGKLKSIDWS